MKTKHKFNPGDKVRLTGKDNPYTGETGEFVRYDNDYLEKERLLVALDSDEKIHYFFSDEVKLISKYGDKK